MEQANANQDGIAATLRQARFSGRMAGTRLLAEAALGWLPEGHPSVLDLGTGSGDLAALLAASRGGLDVTGVDFSPANIAAAEAAHPGLRFACADYLSWQGGQFDMIVADSVLHLIDTPIEALARKLADDLTAGGHVVATVPDGRAVNEILLLARRAWRLTPRAADGLALRIAATLHPGMARDELADRLPYLRMVPRLFGATAQRAFAAAGLTLVASEEWPGATAAKLRHRLMVWRRVSGG